MNRLPDSNSWNTKTQLESSCSRARQDGGSPPFDPPGIQSRHAFFVPARYEKNYAYPLIVWLHSGEGSERQVSEVMPHISVQNYVAVGVRGTRACDSAGHRFDWVHTPSGIVQAELAIMEAIDQAQERYTINPDRIFIAGYKSGGTMAQRVALRNGDRFRGVISLGGCFPRGCRPLANLQQARQLEMLMAIAMENEAITAEALNEDLRLLSSAKLRVQLQQLESEDEMMVPVLRSLDQWMMALVTGQVQALRRPDCDTVPVEFSDN